VETAAVETASVEPTDRERIVAAATDYVESWLDGDPERMAGCLHPALSKRSVRDHHSGDLSLEEAPFDEMTTAAVARPKDYDRELQLSVFEVVDGIASARTSCEPFVDLLHLARFDGRWLIVNVLYEERPAADVAGDPSGPRTVFDYYASSWFDRDAELARAIYHPRFVERRDAHPDDGLELEEVAIEDVLAEVEDGAPGGTERRWEADVFSVDGDIASGRVSVGPWDVYLHLARFGERWLIVNVLYRVGAPAS
jgi:hypothetical protein